jgi:glycerophosphoryl diester phosphodiesterase
VVSKKMSVMRRFQEVSDGQVATGASLPEQLAFILCSYVYQNCSMRTSYQAPQVWKGIVDARLVQAAHRSEIRVDVWTVDEEGDMRHILGYGVDGIMTDRPDRLNRVLKE